jgi:hypothetical protein
MIVSPPRETYRQSYLVRAVLTFVFLTAASLVFVIGQQEEKTKVITTVIAAAIVVVNVLLWVAIGKTTLTIHDEGVRRVSIFGVKEIEWHDVKEYRYRVVSTNAGAAHAGGLIGILIVALISRTAGGRKATTNFYLQLVSKDGVKLWITSSFKNAYEAIGTILGKVHDQLRAQVVNEISASGATFGQIRLNTRELQWKSKDPVPLAELAYAEIAGSSMLQIKKTGKFLSLVSVRSDKVPNVLLFLEQMEKLGVGAKRANAVDPLMHVRS